MAQSACTPHITSLVPLYHWRGARPWLLDLDSDQTGWIICLSLNREGDASLLPIAWQQGNTSPDPDAEPSPPLPVRPIPTPHTDALDSEAVALTLADLQQDGWQVNGRIVLQFTGRDTEPDFHQTIQSYLWQKPGNKDKG